MKKYVIAVFLLFAGISIISAQDRNAPSRPSLAQQLKNDSIIDVLPTSGRVVDTVAVNLPNIYAWKITPRLGERIFVPRDTATIDFHQSMLVDGQSVAMGYLGNIGSPTQSKIFFERSEPSRFMFMDAIKMWRPGPEDHYFLNTKIPYSNIKYQSGGGGESAENRFQGELSINMGKKLNVGFNLDYIYSRGFYRSLSNKGVSYDFYASYIGDKYKMHAYFHNNNFTVIENGGISDFGMEYLSSPNEEKFNDIRSSMDIPVRMTDTWNKLRGRHLYVTNRYDLGNDTEEYAVNDSTMGLRKKKDYIAPASVILTTHYTDQRRNFLSNFIGMDDLYLPTDLYKPEHIENGMVGSSYQNNIPPGQGQTGGGSAINDLMSYYSFKNTLALAMNEGFRNWIKFGLTAFVEYDMRKFTLPSGFPGSSTRYSEDALTIGGVLTKQKGKYLRYRASGELDLLNADYKLEGELGTMLKFRGNDFSVKANAYVKSTSPSFYQNKFVSQYWNWDFDGKLDHINRVYVGGEINFPELSFSKTKISGGVENIDKYIYYGWDKLPVQHSEGVQVLSLRLDQNFNAGILHWDNKMVYQTSSNEEVISLPKFSLYSNLYITSKLAKVLTFQLGVDVHYHTKYYMQGYEPLTMGFYNTYNAEMKDNEEYRNSHKFGNYPLTTAYLNLHLKYTRFFVMLYNATEGMFNKESYSLYRYPYNPRVLKLGISWQFNN